MQVRNHRIDDIWYRQTRNLSAGRIMPKVLVTHYTTGWSGTGSRDWLLGAAGGTSNTGSSAHVVIDRDGTAWQIAPFNRRAWHAGPSKYGSLEGLNTHSIGLEFVNPGWLKPNGHGGWVDSFGNRRTRDQLEEFGGYVERAHARVGSDVFVWPLYTPEQIATGLEIARAVLRRYPIRAVATHEEIDTRGWKTDPGPAFPQEAFTDLVDARAPDGDDEPERYLVSATRLNIRGGPGTDNDRIEPPGSLPRDTAVRIMRREGSWAFVEVIAPRGGHDGLEPGLRGWVSADYLDLDFA